MPHIHTKPGQHDHTVSAYIIRLDGDEPKIMLHRHKVLKKFLQFGGHIELDENTWQALIHELKEESGYDIEQMQVLQPLHVIKKLNGGVLHPTPLSHQTHQFGDQEHFHSDVAFALTAHAPPKHQVAEGESTDIQLFWPSS